MSRDSNRNPLHLRQPHHADLFEAFTRSRLAPDEIYVPPQHRPLNPEDEDDVVPDQHAAFGIARATQQRREPAWRDLGLEELMRRRTGVGEPGTAAGGGGGASGVTGGGTAGFGDAGAVGVGQGAVGLTLRMRRDGDAREGRRLGSLSGGGGGGGRAEGAGGSGGGLPR